MLKCYGVLEYTDVRGQLGGMILADLGVFVGTDRVLLNA